jgi:homoprotocatechuate degradation regulator HpaR
MKSPLRHKNLPHLLLQSRETLMRRFRPVLKQHGLTEQQWRILRVLLDEDGLEPRQLCERCLISSPSITGVLMRMEEAGWIQRARMAHDQRRVTVTVTAATKKLGKSIGPLIEREYVALEKLVGVKQLQQVYDALDTLQKNLGDPDNATDVPH